jgi:phosphatidate cytidylyltransferase
MWIKRILTGLIFLGIFLVSVKVASLWWIFPLIIVGAGLVGIMEFIGMAARKEVHAPLGLGFLLALILFAAAWWGGPAMIITAFLAGLCIVLIYFALIGGIEGAVLRSSVILMSILYVGLPMALGLHFYRLEMLQPGTGLGVLVFIIVVSWSTDTGAYAFGMNFGKHKLTPVLSPNKTVEGSIGGLAASVVAAFLLALFWGSLRKIIPLHHALVLGFLLGVLGQVGDLAESAFKRDAGVKDSGTAIVGHGGILDVVDSLLLTVPLGYLYIHYVIGTL